MVHAQGHHPIEALVLDRPHEPVASHHSIDVL